MINLSRSNLIIVKLKLMKVISEEIKLAILKKGIL